MTPCEPLIASLNEPFVFKSPENRLKFSEIINKQGDMKISEYG